MLPSQRGILFVSVILAALLAGCNRLASMPLLKQETASAISFREVFEQQSGDRFRVEKTERLDVDGDGTEEWVVLYRFDPYSARDWERAPVHGIVYDTLPCEAPIIRDYKLPTPDNDFLSEGPVDVLLEDVLAEPGKGGGAQELIVRGGGGVQTLTILRFFDRRTNYCLPVEEGQRGFHLLGFFRAHAIERDGKIITTKTRTVFERSQLAIRKTYQPRQDLSMGETYLQPDGKTLVDPAEQSVDFSFGLPRDPRDSPYPEKSVAAFYLALGQQNEKAKSYLADPLQPGFETATGLGIPVSRIGRVLIYSLSYRPDVAKEQRHEDVTVEVVVAAVDKNGNRQPPRRLRWRLIGVPIPDRQDCEWRLAELIPLSAEAPGAGPATVLSRGPSAARER